MQDPFFTLLPLFFPLTAEERLWSDKRLLLRLERADRWEDVLTGLLVGIPYSLALFVVGVVAWPEPRMLAGYLAFGLFLFFGLAFWFFCGMRKRALITKLRRSIAAREGEIE